MSKLRSLKPAFAARALGALLAAGLAWQVLGPALPAQSQIAPTPASRLTGPALWVVRDADSTIYLFGTFHALKTGTEWRTPAVQAALDGSSEVWLELADIGTPEAEAASLPLLQRYGLDLHRPLSSKLSRAENAKLARAAAAAGLQPAQLEPLRPWLAGLQLTLAPLMRAGYDAKLGVDNSIAAAARAAGKPVRGFETTEQQLRFFADLSPAAEKQMLVAALDDLEDGPAVIDRLRQAWSRGDLQVLESEMVADMRREAPELHRVLLADRNAAWAKAIAERLKGSGVSFVAVGAAHLVGPDAVQAELAELGVKSERR